MHISVFYMFVCVYICLCLFVCMLVSVYVSPCKCLYKVLETSACFFYISLATSQFDSAISVASQKL